MRRYHSPVRRVVDHHTSSKETTGAMGGGGQRLGTWWKGKKENHRDADGQRWAGKRRRTRPSFGR